LALGGKSRRLLQMRRAVAAQAQRDTISTDADNNRGRAARLQLTEPKEVNHHENASGLGAGDRAGRGGTAYGRLDDQRRYTRRRQNRLGQGPPAAAEVEARGQADRRGTGLSRKGDEGPPTAARPKRGTGARRQRLGRPDTVTRTSGHLQGGERRTIRRWQERTTRGTPGCGPEGDGKDSATGRSGPAGARRQDRPLFDWHVQHNAGIPGI